jgi:hypothetical protein
LTEQTSQEKARLVNEKLKRKRRLERERRLMAKSMKAELRMMTEGMYELRLANTMISRALELDAARSKHKLGYVV